MPTFIVNRGGATASDVRKIIAHVQDMVRTRFGVELEVKGKFDGALVKAIFFSPSFDFGLHRGLNRRAVEAENTS